MTLRAKEVDYDKEMIKTVKQPWYAYKFVKMRLSQIVTELKKFGLSRIKVGLLLVTNWNCGEFIVKTMFK